MGRDDYREERVKNAVKKHGKTLWHGVMNMELPISFSQSKKLWIWWTWGIRRLTKCWRSMVWFTEDTRAWEDRIRFMFMICSKQIIQIGCQNKLYSERGAAMRKKYYEDAKENAAFERCADVITSLILKYGPALKQKWNLNEWIRNIQAESLWKDMACKRYQRYFICMMNMKSVSAWQNQID